MKQSVAFVALVVRDYDEAIEFYTKKLHQEVLKQKFYFLELLNPNKKHLLVIKPGDECFFFSKLMIFGAIIKR